MRSKTEKGTKKPLAKKQIPVKEQKQNSLASITVALKGCKPYISQFNGNSFKDKYPNFFYHLLGISVDRKGVPVDRKLDSATTQANSLIFRDPNDQDYLLLWNVEVAKISNISNLLYTQATQKGLPQFSQDCDKEIFAHNLLTLENKKALVRINFKLLKQNTEVILSPEFIAELEKSPPWPEPCANELLVLTQAKHKYSDKYIIHLMIKKLRDEIQESGYSYDENDFFITKEAYLLLGREVENIKDEYQGNYQNESAFTRYSYLFNFGDDKVFIEDERLRNGYRVSREKVDELCKKYGIEPIDVQLLANISTYRHVENRGIKHKNHGRTRLVSSLDQETLGQEKVSLVSVDNITDTMPPSVDASTLSSMVGRPVIIYPGDRLDKLAVRKVHLLDAEGFGSWGLFATKPIEENTTVCRYNSKDVTAEEAKVADDCLLELDGGRCVSGKNSLGGFINGSSSVPNVDFKDNKARQIVEICTIKKIEAGEQLLLNYHCTAGYFTTKNLRSSESKGVLGEIYLNPYCNEQTFDQLLQQTHYKKLPQEFQGLSRELYHDEDYDLWGTDLILAILEGRSSAIASILAANPARVHEPILRAVKNTRKAAPGPKQDLLYPLILAAHRGPQEVLVPILLQKQLKRNLLLDIQRTVSGASALHAALRSASSCRLKIVTLLLRYGAQLTVQDENEETPLHLCAKQGLTSEMKAIMVYCFKNNQSIGFLTSYIDKDNYDFLTLALINNNLRIIELFFEYLAEQVKQENIFAPSYFANEEQAIKCLANITSKKYFLELINKYTSLINRDFVDLVRRSFKHVAMEKGREGFFTGQEKRKRSETEEVKHQPEPKKTKTEDGREQEPDDVTPPGGCKGILKRLQFKRLQQRYSMDIDIDPMDDPTLGLQ